ncbi:hypothetical protein [Aeromicrobium fastidiosum]|uniref:DUF2238 domain-containing protein n=1 Tax=Aeromicrobium fastidiosum TaxID=52699 RepID=A0A641AMC1_9ACTN|nr:hypothetical protein [Aeromicrobium fastidiosum]KAA1374871.1 hypothetical protein ESP62_015985 [Aeromicrobium fastidiosum]MBP2390564.1 hypothetical protein [Aeromicrobium fastidiosum]
MSSVALATRYPAPPLLRSADIAAKTGLILLVGLALIVPGLGNMDGKGLLPRAIGYPVAAFAIPFIWFTWWRQRASFPWAADFLITFACFSDIFGNFLNLYDSVDAFDNVVHFVNTGLLTAAVILLTMHRSTRLSAVLERALAFGVSAALVWEIAEYFAFLRWSPERLGAYADTLSDMSLGALGSLLAAFTVHALWSRGHLTEVAPQLELAHQERAGRR